MAAANVLVPASADAERLRFELELEFVNLMADMSYVAHLSTEGYLQKPSFLRYLRYLLTTWSAPAYAKHVRFPLSLLHLRLAVHDEAFRELASNAVAAAELRGAEIAAWRAAAAPAASSAGTSTSASGGAPE